jgi:Tfp pilus assembly protein PilN
MGAKPPMPPGPPRPPSGGEEIGTSVASSDPSQIAQPLAERLLAEIRRSLEYYTSQEDGAPVTRIYITGAGCMLGGVKEFLATRLNMEILELDVFGTAKIAGTVENPHSFQSAYGLALRLLKPADITLNLLPSDLSARLAEGAKAVWNRYAALLGIVLLAEIVGLGWLEYAGRMTKVEALRQQYDGEVRVNDQPVLIDGRPVLNREVLEKMAEIQQRRESLDMRFKAISSLEDGKYDWIAIMDALRRCVPENCWIEASAFSFTPTGITLSLKTTIEDNSRIFYRNVKSSQYLDYSGTGINLTRSKEDGVNVWAWSATLTFKFQKAGSADESEEFAP